MQLIKQGGQMKVWELTQKKLDTNKLKRLIIKFRDDTQNNLPVKEILVPKQEGDQQQYLLVTINGYRRSLGEGTEVFFQ